MKKLLLILLIPFVLNAQILVMFPDGAKELNPNPNFANWSYVDLLAGWNLTSGWTVGVSGTIIDSNSFSTTGYGGFVKSLSGVVLEQTYKLTFVGQTTASQFRITTTGGTTAPNPTMMPTSTGAINYSGVFYWGGTNNNIFLNNQTAGTTDITSISLKKLIPPTGFTSATMNATNYVIQSGGCKFVEATGITAITSSANIKKGGRRIEVVQDWTQGTLYVGNGTDSTALPQADGTKVIKLVFDGTQKLKVSCANNTTSIISYLSIK